MNKGNDHNEGMSHICVGKILATPMHCRQETCNTVAD